MFWFHYIGALRVYTAPTVVVLLRPLTWMGCSFFPFARMEILHSGPRSMVSRRLTILLLVWWFYYALHGTADDFQLKRLSL